MSSFREILRVNSQGMAVYNSLPSGSGPFPAVVIAHPIS